MDQIREAINILHNSNARHRRKGFKYKNNTPTEMLKHAAEEFVELVEADAKYTPQDTLARSAIAEELADLMMILLHYARYNGITNHELQNSMFDKFLKRFTLTRKEKKAIEALQAQMNAHHRQKLRLYGEGI